MTTVQQRLFSTIAYADVFDFPLTKREVHTWMISGGKFSSILPAGTTAYVVGKDIFYVLTGKKGSITRRLKRRTLAKGKWYIARRAAGPFCFIPSVLLVGVTGGLSMDNADSIDDIDLFFVVASGTLWITRLLVTLLAEVYGIRRRPADTSVTNKMCLNMFMAADRMRLVQSDRDLFTAHEILQMVPLWEREDAYRKFLIANTWVKDFLPNAWDEKRKASGIKNQVSNKHQTSRTKFQIFLDLVFRYCLEFIIWSLKFLEQPSRSIQIWYMGRRRTTEVITDTMLRFHPKDARLWVKKKFATRLNRQNIPLDKIFYHR